ncbi:MAG: Flp pilus assembly protein CpaB [Aggregatilineales bacterium]
MNRRVLLLLLVVVVGVGAAALLLVNQQNQSNGGGNNPGGGGNSGQGGSPPTQIIDTATPIIETPIIIAVQELPRGIRIPRNGIDVRNYPKDATPEFAIGADPKNLEAAFTQVVGKIARNDIARDQPILSTMLVDDLTQLAKVGSDAAAVIPTDRRAIAIPIDRNSAVAYAPRPGDYVDVIGSFLFTDVDQTFQSRLPDTITFTVIKQDGTIDLTTAIQGRLEPSTFSQFPLVVGPTETQRPRLATQMIVQSALVVQMGNFPLSGHYLGNTPTPLATATLADQSQQTPNAPPPATATQATPDVITIAVTPQEAVVLTWMMDARVPMTLVLRNAQNQNRTPTAEVTLRYIVQNFTVDEPAALPFALDPALRSIRSLTSGTLVPFAQDNTFAGK